MEEDYEDVTFDDLRGDGAETLVGSVAIILIGGAKVLLVTFFLLVFIAGFL